MKANMSLKKRKSLQALQTSELWLFEKLKMFNIQFLSTHVQHTTFLGYNSGMCSMSIENTFGELLFKETKKQQKKRFK